MEMEKIKSREPGITREVMGAAAAVGGECAHLDQRVKSPASMVRKVRTEQELSVVNGGAGSAAQIAGGMKDVVRYTVVHQEHSRLAEVTEKTVLNLREQGWSIHKIKSTYVKGAAYKGIHIIGKTSGGVTTEVQVHSAASLEVKKQNDELYEIYRDPNKSKRERRAAMHDCARRSVGIPTPEGLDKLTCDGYLCVSKS